MSSHGVVFVATRKLHFVVEAFLSAHSIKEKDCGIPITLFTDLIDTPYAKCTCFDDVIEIKTTRNYTSLWAEGQLDRIKCLVKSPYDYTLHLDTDTRVMTDDICTIFDKLDNHDICMAVCEPDASVCSSVSGYSMFNVGVILFRRSEATARLLTMWRDLTQRHFEIATDGDPAQVEYLSHLDDVETKKRMLFMDQTSMVQILSPEINKADVELEILDEGWNFRGAFNGRELSEKLKISHDPVLRNRLGPDTVNVANQYLMSGDKKFAGDIYTNMLAEFPLEPNERTILQGMLDKTRN